jgi:hypothetical protein
MILQATRILVSVQIVDDNDSVVFVFALILSIFERLHQAILSIRAEWRIWCEAVGLANKVIVISFKALAFGVGINL